MSEQKQIKLKIENIWAVLCMASSVDDTTNNISLFNLIERYTFSVSVKENKDKHGNDVRKGLKNGIPLPVNYRLVSLWSRPEMKTYPEVKTKMLIELVDPQKKILLKQESDVEFTKDKRRMRYIIDFNQFIITGDGDYMFRIRLKHQDENDWVEIPLEVRVNILE